MFSGAYRCNSQHKKWYRERPQSGTRNTDYGFRLALAGSSLSSAYVSRIYSHSTRGSSCGSSFAAIRRPSLAAMVARRMVVSSFKHRRSARKSGLHETMSQAGPEMQVPGESVCNHAAGLTSICLETRHGDGVDAEASAEATNNSPRPASKTTSSEFSKGSKCFCISATTSVDDTPTIRAPQDQAIAFAVAMPTRRPVKDPGPRTTTTNSVSAIRQPAFLTVAERSGVSRLACCRGESSDASNRVSPWNTATEAIGPLESIAMVFIGHPLLKIEILRHNATTTRGQTANYGRYRRHWGTNCSPERSVRLTLPKPVRTLRT